MLNFTYARDLPVALLITLSYTVSPKPYLGLARTFQSFKIVKNPDPKDPALDCPEGF